MPVAPLPCSASDTTPNSLPQAPYLVTDQIPLLLIVILPQEPGLVGGQVHGALRREPESMGLNAPHTGGGKARLCAPCPRTLRPPGHSADRGGLQRGLGPAVSPSYLVVWLSNVFQTTGHGISLVCQDYLYFK